MFWDLFLYNYRCRNPVLYRHNIFIAKFLWFWHQKLSYAIQVYCYIYEIVKTLWSVALTQIAWTMQLHCLKSVNLRVDQMKLWLFSYWIRYYFLLDFATMLNISLHFMCCVSQIWLLLIWFFDWFFFILIFVWSLNSACINQ